MILLTALSSKKFYLNPDLIYRMEETPDTTITLTDGKTLVVQDSAEEVVAAVLEYRRAIYREMLQAVKKSEE
ncbi:MAG: flagellar FlbD family protein [Enterococcus aquimarinus]|uniref:Flagellar FlbD family protein n=1 Tax=Enterococcus aquimarinus TaxID=328396 RepID=A0A9E3ZSA2_9ENTE|nr:flagellar FlbD family protein [Enterococcus aquimarinus]